MVKTFKIIVIMTIWFHISAISYSTSIQRSPNPLNGQHLRVMMLSGYLLQSVLNFKIYQLRISFQPLWSGNRKGLSGPLKGGAILDYLATRWNFT